MKGKIIGSESIKGMDFLSQLQLPHSIHSVNIQLDTLVLNAYYIGLGTCSWNKIARHE